MNFLVVIVVLTTIVCVLLTLVVLIQNPKGGGLSATFGGISTSMLGAQRTTDILEKATWTLAIILIGFSLLSKFFTPRTLATPDQPTSQLDVNPGFGGASPEQAPNLEDDNTAWPFGRLTD